ncbi:MAG: EamA family transporter RarD [Alphaproteobacteria bacterium]
MTNTHDKHIGFLAAVLAYTLWGMLPIYWHSMAAISPLEILSHRILWSALVTIIAMTILGRWGDIRLLLKNRRTSMAAMACTILISINWLVFIWAISVGRTLESSLGYFINPLLNVLIGALFLHERLSRLQIAAVVCAAIGVFYAVIGAGQLPWIALVLAASFSMYGYLRKIMMADSLTGLTAETCLLAPLALFGVVWFWGIKGSAFGTPIGTTPHLLNIALLIGAGPVTAAPLLLFAAGARRLPFSTIGFLQYLAPSLMFVISIVLFHEPLTLQSTITFLCIWAGIALYILDGLFKQRVAVINP